ncbi:hypothetical protein N752_21395 [Desulforamulus aquiferis]|nr:hypothetical protein N752_21395 [Desulforamulus aquiferis]
MVFTLIVFGFGVGATIFSVLSWVKKVSRIKDGLMSWKRI